LNYVQAWQAAPFLRFFINSAVMTVGTTLQTGPSFLGEAGHAFAYLPGRNILFFRPGDPR